MDLSFHLSAQTLRRLTFALNSSDPWIRWHESLVHWVDDAIDIIIKDQLNAPPEKVLDIATGTSGPLFRLLNTFSKSHIQACDIDSNLLELGAMLIEERKEKRIHLSKCNAEELIYSTDEFDLVICLFSFMYFKNANKTIDEMIRVLKPNRKGYITTWGDFNALFNLVTKVLSWDASYQYQENMNPQAYAEEDKMNDLLKNRNIKTFTINKHRINLSWLGSANEFWQFFKASNKAVENHLLYKLNEDERMGVESMIIDEIEMMKQGDFIKVPVDMLCTTFQV